MALTGQQLRALRNALVNAFNPTAFEQMLRFELDKKVANIAGSGPLNTVAFRVIDAAEMEGWTLDLVRAARIANPGNANLHQVADMLALSSTRELQPAALNFEKVVRDGVPFLDPTAFRSKLGRIELQVCSIELNGVGHGSGVLVGPDYVLTNHHVISKATKDTKLACRFDFAASADGKVINPASRWMSLPTLSNSSPPSRERSQFDEGRPVRRRTGLRVVTAGARHRQRTCWLRQKSRRAGARLDATRPERIEYQRSVARSAASSEPGQLEARAAQAHHGKSARSGGRWPPPAPRRQHPSRLVGLAVLLGVHWHLSHSTTPEATPGTPRPITTRRYPTQRSSIG